MAVLAQPLVLKDYDHIIEHYLKLGTLLRSGPADLDRCAKTAGPEILEVRRARALAGGSRVDWFMDGF